MNETTVTTTLADLIRRVSPRPIDGEVPLDVPLGEEGVGLDSIARVELLAEIDLSFGVLLPVALVADGCLAARELVARLLIR